MAEGEGKTIISLGGTSWTFDLPRSITYQTEYGWETVELGTAGLIAGSHGGFDGVDGFNKILGNIGPEDIKAASTRAFMNTNAFNLGALAQKNSQKSPNPKEAVMFKGVQFRSYSLDFMIAGESSSDVREKAAYINEMKVAAAPELIDKQYFFKWPDTGTLEINDGSTDVLKPRDIVVTSINVDLTPNGYFATWSKGGPVSFNASIGFTELHLPTKETEQDVLGFA